MKKTGILLFGFVSPYKALGGGWLETCGAEDSSFNKTP
jgi:hypothetical protein